jgi:hypothetical protein
MCTRQRQAAFCETLTAVIEKRMPGLYGMDFNASNLHKGIYIMREF